MRALRRHAEGHRTDRIGWLRAAVLGANDGIVSTASLVVGVGAELEKDPVAEQHELAAIYAGRGLDPALAQQVAEQLMAHDAIAAHGRDELGITDALGARPVQAALASAASFAVGALLPLGVTALASGRGLMPWVAGTSLAFLALLGATAARVGGASVLAGAWRVGFWGALAMASTAGVGAMFGAVV
jgi:VIT1/CCC1 family predicted Fe2+/Mn2+ transporter